MPAKRTSKKKTSRKTKPGNPAISAFVKAVRGGVGTLLSTFGFIEEKTRVDKTSASCLFGKGAAYVDVTINLHPLDSPHFCNVVLGNGARTWPESDWNGVALWRLARERANASMSEYRLDSFPDVPTLVVRMRNDLEHVANDFLRGDLELFARVRAEVNRQREPYKVHRRSADGTLMTEVDHASVALKALFS